MTLHSLSPHDTAHFLEEALRIITDIRPAILARFNAGPEVEWKSDLTPVTIADKEAELRVRESIAKKFPSHGIQGEEFGASNPGSPFQWIVDPIDGTQSFIHGIPTFGTMLALEHEGRSIVGIIDHPALSLCYAAAAGNGAACNGIPIRIKDVPLDSEGWLHPGEVLCLPTRSAFAISGAEARWDDLVRRNRLYRIYYDCFGGSRAVSGSAGTMIEMNVPAWDIAPFPVMVREAGGQCFELPRWVDGKGTELRSMVFGKPSHAKRLFEYMEAPEPR